MTPLLIYPGARFVRVCSDIDYKYRKKFQIDHFCMAKKLDMNKLTRARSQ